MILYAALCFKIVVAMIAFLLSFIVWAGKRTFSSSQEVWCIRNGSAVHQTRSMSFSISIQRRRWCTPAVTKRLPFFRSILLLRNEQNACSSHHPGRWQAETYRPHPCAWSNLQMRSDSTCAQQWVSWISLRAGIQDLIYLRVDFFAPIEIKIQRMIIAGELNVIRRRVVALRGFLLWSIHHSVKSSRKKEAETKLRKTSERDRVYKMKMERVFIEWGRELCKDE